MTMHLILGEGEMPKKELAATLKDLQEKVQSGADEAEFWLIVQGKDEPTATDKALMAWIKANEVYFEVLSTVAETELDDIYEGRQAFHKGAKLPIKAVNLLKTNSEGSDDVSVLGLFTNIEEETPEDLPLLDVLQAAIDAGFDCYGLNDSMTKIDLSGEDGDAEAEGEEEEAPPTRAKKGVASKAAPKKASAKSGPRAITEEELDALSDAEVRAIGQSMGITTRNRANWIAKILEKQGPVDVKDEGEGDEDEEETTVAPTKSKRVASSTSPNGKGSGTVVSGAMVMVVNPEHGSIIIKPLTQEMAEVIIG